MVKNMYSVLHELEDISMTVPSSMAKLYFGPWDLIKKRVSNVENRGWSAASCMATFFMIGHSNMCHRPRTSSCHKDSEVEQNGGWSSACMTTYA